MLRRRFVVVLSCEIVFVILYFAIIDGRFKQPGVFFLQHQSPENEDERLKSQVYDSLHFFGHHLCYTSPLTCSFIRTRHTSYRSFAGKN